jgi:hypothetical protein
MKKMKYENLPPIVSQTIESLLDPKTPERIKFNHRQTLEKIRDGCDFALSEDSRKQKKNFL